MAARRQAEAIPAATDPVTVADVLGKHDGDRIGELSANAAQVRMDAGGRRWWGVVLLETQRGAFRTAGSLPLAMRFTTAPQGFHFRASAAGGATRSTRHGARRTTTWCWRRG